MFVANPDDADDPIGTPAETRETLTMILLLATPVLLAILSPGDGATMTDALLKNDTPAAAARSGAAPQILEARRDRGRGADDGVSYA